MSLLYVFHGVSNDFGYCVKHPNVVEIIWSVFEYFPIAFELNFDDIMIKMALELIETELPLPSYFEQVVIFILSSFDQYEYESICHYGFIECAIKRCKECPAILELLYTKLSEAFSYIIYYPEERSL